MTLSGFIMIYMEGLWVKLSGEINDVILLYKNGTELIHGAGNIILKVSVFYRRAEYGIGHYSSRKNDFSHNTIVNASEYKKSISIAPTRNKPDV